MIQLTTYIVSNGTLPQRIDKFLCESFSYNNRSIWQHEIDEGNITLNDKVVTTYNKTIKSGDCIKYIGEKYAEPKVNTNYSIIFEDEFIIAVNKPSNLPTHPSGIFYNNTLQCMLEKQYNQKVYAVHRLDRETSGVIVFTKDAKSCSQIQKTFNTCKKVYIAITRGVIENNFFCEHTSIGKHRSSLIKRKQEAYDGAEKDAITNFKTLKCFEKNTLVCAMPETGRQHQIRVHLAHLGFPIMGDKLYGFNDQFYLQYAKNGLNENLQKMLDFPRCALHAKNFIFTHPHTKQKIELVAHLASDMQNFILQNDHTLV